MTAFEALRAPVLGVKRGTFRDDDPDAHLKDAGFRKVRKSVLAASGGSCAYCGWGDAVGLEVHHLDDDHGNNQPENLVACCRLCHMVHHLGFIGASGLGVLFYGEMPLPHQGVWNVLLRCLWIAERCGGTELSASASETLNELDALAASSRRLIPGLTPLAIGSQLREMDDAEYGRRGEFLSKVRVLYDRRRFVADIDRWGQAVGRRDWAGPALKMHAWLVGSGGSGDLEMLQERALGAEDGQLAWGSRV